MDLINYALVAFGAGLSLYAASGLVGMVAFAVRLSRRDE